MWVFCIVVGGGGFWKSLDEELVLFSVFFLLFNSPPCSAIPNLKDGKVMKVSGGKGKRKRKR